MALTVQFAALASIVVLAACSMSSQYVTPATRSLSPSAELQNRAVAESTLSRHPEALVYVANFASNAVTVYQTEKQDPTPIRTLTNGIVAPRSLWIDASGTLYVSNDFGNNNPYKDTVTEFASGASSPTKVLTGLYFPGAIAVDSKGTVFVEDDAAAATDVYENGSTTPTRQITGFDGSATAMTVDAAGNLYSAISWGERCQSDVVKIPPGASSGKRLFITVAGCADGIALDSRGNIYFGYFGDNNVSAVNVYRPGAHAPFRRILQGVNAPFQLAFDRDGALYVPNDNGTNVTVYPAGGDAPSITISRGIQNPFGVAIAPRAALAP